MSALVCEHCGEPWRIAAFTACKSNPDHTNHVFVDDEEGGNAP